MASVDVPHVRDVYTRRTPERMLFAPCDLSYQTAVVFPRLVCQRPLRFTSKLTVWKRPGGVWFGIDRFIFPVTNGSQRLQQDLLFQPFATKMTPEDSEQALARRIKTP
jgi:hypothetical protein